MKPLRRCLILVVSCMLLCACERIRPEDPAPPAVHDSRVKNVILLIGDGMGPQQLGLLVTYAHHAPHSVYKARGSVTALEGLMEAGTIGYARCEPAGALVTDSAASSTQIASGEWTVPGRIGIDRHDNVVKTVLEIAQDMGKSTGLVTDTGITHATPAAFASHRTHRSEQDSIAVDFLATGVDVMLGGGLEWWIPREANDRDSETHRQLEKATGGTLPIESKRKDSRNLLEEASALGYELCFNRSDIEQASGDRILGLFARDGLMHGIEETRTKDDPGRSTPTLKEMTAKALEVLSRNRDGFFLMVEAGQIDWAAHDNDAGALLHEMLKLDETVALLHRWAEGRRDTLLLVTADHETGGFGFSYSRWKPPTPRPTPESEFQVEIPQSRLNYGNYGILDRIYNQKLSYPEILERFDTLPEARRTPAALAEIVAANTEFPITEEEAARVLEGEMDEPWFYGPGKGSRTNRLARAISREQMTVWATGMHTNTPVPLITYGPPHASGRYGKMMHTTEWGRMTIGILTHGE